MTTSDGLVIAVLLLIGSEFATLIALTSLKKKFTDLRRQVTSLEMFRETVHNRPTILKVQSGMSFETLDKESLIEKANIEIKALNRTDPRRLNLIRFKAIAIKSNDRNAYLQLKSYIRFINGNVTKYTPEEYFKDDIVKNYFDANSIKNE